MCNIVYPGTYFLRIDRLFLPQEKTQYLLQYRKSIRRKTAHTFIHKKHANSLTKISEPIKSLQTKNIFFSVTLV